MKLTFVLPGYSNRPIGGYKVVYQYANFLSNSNIDVNIVYANILSPAKEYDGYKGKVRLLLKFIYFYIKKLRKKTKWFSLESNVTEKFVNILSLKDIENNDVLIATSWETCYLINKFNLSKIKKFYFIQGIEFWSGSEDQVLNTWKYIDFENIVISTGLKEFGIKHNVDSNLVPNFINPKEFYLKKPIRDRKPSIVMMYHENPLKGFKEGLDALKIVKRDYPEIAISIFGTDSRPDIIPMNIGYEQRPNMVDLFNQASIYLVPSRTEGWGLTSTEAMASGTALVTTDNGGCRDFAIDEETALVVNVGDVNSMVNKIEELLRDDKLRCNLASAGKKKIEEYTLQVSGNKLLNLLNISGDY